MKTNFRVSNKIEAFYTGGKVQLSKDGRHMFCSHDDKINILCVETGKVLHIIKQEDGDVVTCFAVSSDDEILVVAYRNLLLKKWDWKEEKCTRTWKAIHRGPIVSMAFDSTTTLLATGSSDFTIKIWDIVREYCTHNLRESTGIVSVVEFHPHPDRLQLFSAGDDCKVRVWDLTTSRTRAVLKSHNSAVTSFAFSQDGNMMLTGGRDSIVIIWDLTEYKPMKTIPIYEGVEFVMIVPNPADYKEELNLTKNKGFHFITAGAQGVLKVWNSDSSNCVFQQKQTITAAKDPESKGVETAITQASYCLARDAIALVTYDHNIIFYALKGFQLVKQFVGYNEEILDVKFMGEKCSHIAIASNSEQIRVFELSSHSCQILVGHTDTVLELDVFSKGLLLASCSKDNSIRLWRMDGDSGAVFCVAVGIGHTHSVGTVATARLSNKFLASGSGDQTLKVWSVPLDLPMEPGETVSQLKVKFTEKAHDKDINSVDISPNDKLVATGSQDRTAKLWHLDQEVMLGSFRGHKRGIWCVKFSPTDQALVTSSADGTLKIWALTNFTCVKTFDGHDSSVMKVMFLTKGMQLLSCGSDGLLKLWTIKSNECVKTLDEHTDKVWTLTANKAENCVVSGGGDSNLIIWEDVTVVEQEEERDKMEDQLIKEQRLSNLLHDKKYLKAIRLAITLEQPFRLLNIVKKIMEEPEGLDGLETTIKKLRSDQKEATLRFAKEWNTNSRHCHTAQIVISIILKGNTPEELMSNPSMQQTLEGLIPYTDRHFKRMNRLLQQAMFVEHTWQKMRRVTTPATTESSNLHDSQIPEFGDSSLDTNAMDTTEGNQPNGQKSEDKRLPGYLEGSSDSDGGSSNSESSDDEDETGRMSADTKKHLGKNKYQSDSEESDDEDEKMLTRTNVKRSRKGQEDDESSEEEGSDSEESNDEDEKMLTRTNVKRSHKGQVDDESSEEEGSDSEESNDEDEKMLTRTNVKRSHKGQVDDESSEEEDGSEVHMLQQPSTKRKKKGEDKENDNGEKLIQTKLKMGKTGIVREAPTKRAGSSKKKDSLFEAVQKKTIKQAELYDEISPRKTRSSYISNRLRKTSTSSR